MANLDEQVNIRILEHKRDYKKRELKSKLFMDSLEIDHILDFDNSEIVRFKYNDYDSRIFLEVWNTKMNKFTVKEVSKVSCEYAVL